jgi:acetyl-CoA carboxylase biotin carboxyl carrier protein
MSEPVRTESGSLVDELCRHTARLMAVAGVGIRRIRVHAGDAGVELEWPDPPPQAAASGPEPPTPADHPAPHERPGTHSVRAPMVGTFYRAPAPGAPPFVREGDTVEPGQQIAIIEAMKLMNPIEAERGGTVVEVLVADAEPVEYDQPLIVLNIDGGQASD